MVKKNAATREDPVRLSVVYSGPVSEKFCNSVGTSRMEPCGFSLWSLLRLAEHFGSRSLVEASVGTNDPNCFKQVECTKTCNLGCRIGLIKRDSDKTLCREVVTFIGCFEYAATGGPSAWHGPWSGSARKAESVPTRIDANSETIAEFCRPSSDCRWSLGRIVGYPDK